jgi:prepilin-type N-terminal cleavage/methylation domain-containing protein
MLELILKAKRNERGFTLIELIMVLVILGILLALALPQYLATRRKAYLAEADQNLQEMRTQAWTFYLERNTFAGVATTINPPAASPNWEYAWGTCDDTSCEMTATGQGPVDGATVTVTLNNTGQATVTSTGF